MKEKKVEGEEFVFCVEFLLELNFAEIFGEDCGVVPTKLALVTPLTSNCFPIYSLNFGGHATTE
jgi:hypothetical protein